MTECYFTPSKNTTSATICKNCGLEKMLHTIGEGIKASTVIITSTPSPTPLDTQGTYTRDEIRDNFRQFVEYDTIDTILNSIDKSGKKPDTQGEDKEPFVTKQFNSNKYYWCKCESCGWEDSSQYCEGGGQIGDTGGYSDPICPICFSNKLEGEPTLNVTEQYEGIVPVKMPLDLILAPYIKILKSYQKIEDDKHWEEMAKMEGYLKKTTTPSPVSSAEVMEEALRKIEMKSFRKDEWTEMEEINKIAKAALTSFTPASSPIKEDTK